MSAVARILELEARGINMSRNRHFEVFEKRENRAALDVWRHLAAVRRSLFKHRELGDVNLELHRERDGEHFRLVASINDIAARMEWRLHAGEIGILLRDEEVRRWFDREGLKPPEASVAYMAGGVPS